MLSKTYISCLEISFCCISTGIYGFNKFNASKDAVNTVNQWVKKVNMK